VARVIWTAEALDDIEAIGDYVLGVAPERATALLSGIIDAIRNIPFFPRSGRIVPELQRDDVREVIYRGYHIVYRLADDTAWILLVFHGAQGIMGRLRDLEERDE